MSFFFCGQPAVLQTTDYQRLLSTFAEGLYTEMVRRGALVWGDV